MSGVQDTLKDGLVTPSSEVSTDRGAPIPVPGGQKRHPVATSPRSATDAPYHSIVMTSKSWNDKPAPRSTIAFSSAGHVRRPTFSQVISPEVNVSEKKVSVFDKIFEERCVSCARAQHFYASNLYAHSDQEVNCLEPQLLEQFVQHVLVYAEMLFGWQLFHKRVELLKSVNQEIQKVAPPPISFGCEKKLSK
jgi:hypothetical protein